MHGPSPPPGQPALPPAPRPVFPEQHANGAALSLLRFIQTLSPRERLRLMERKALEIRTLNEYGRRHRQARVDADR